MYAGADTNGDTAISKQEWTTFLEDMRNSPDFDSTDANNNGRIDVEEWNKNMKRADASMDGSTTSAK